MRHWPLPLVGIVISILCLGAPAGVASAAPAFDHRKLAESLSKAAGKEFAADKLPFEAIEFVGEEKAVQFKVGDTAWKCDLATYACTKAEPAKPSEPAKTPPDKEESAPAN